MTSLTHERLLSWRQPYSTRDSLCHFYMFSRRLIAISVSHLRRPIGALWLVVLFGILLLPSTAGAHTETGAVGGIVSGLRHPVSGLDHVVAMVAVGLWGAFLGVPAMWLLPVVFPMVMAMGGATGVLGMPVPGVETCVALSGVMLGLAVALAARPPLWVAAVMVGFFAIFHGHAHGRELPAAANAITFAVGFVVATGLLHLSGIALGLLVRWPWGGVVVRAGGAVIAGVGFAFLFHLL